MSTCSGCGGVLGRDCFNEYDCVQIGRSMEMHDTVQPYVEALKQAKELILFMDKHMELQDVNLMETYCNEIANTMNLLDRYIPVERSSEQRVLDDDDLPF